ncbi:hypothetical protein KC19_4G216800 [Ceratodon purpureus]|uniref:Uncharacterized protein n=1 Tax=Ceratodon purpureus TaxID=3225 RepID=A0A8T0IDL3_CERPU|nr:hypothetical protein KC19_4G216800 [Ceratodon purpureus]
MSTEGEHVDADVAENLTNAAKEALEKPQGSGTDGDVPAKDSPASEFIQNVAHIVLDKSNQAADSSKAYIENAVHKVQDYAQNVASGATGSTSNIQETLSKAVHIGAHPGSTTASPGEGDASSGGDGGLLTSVATWCSTLCGSKNNAPGGEPRSVDFRAAAENVAAVLHSSTAPTSSPVESPSPYDVTPAETPPEAPASEPPKPTASE